jgi:uncharacterized repeat protein (TIGR01451 family)
MKHDLNHDQLPQRSQQRHMIQFVCRVALCLLALSAGFAPAPMPISATPATHDAGMIRSSGATRGAGSSALSPALQRALNSTPAGDQLHILVRFKAQADLAPFAAPSRSRAPAMRAALVNTLQRVASASQQPFAAFLASPMLRSEVSAVRSFWIFNGAALSATPRAIQAITARDDVASISIDEWRQWIGPSVMLTTGSGITIASPYSRTSLFTAQQAQPSTGSPWGVSKIRADQVWRGLNVTGAGVTVGTVDSGVDWQHVALQTSYRGWRGSGFPPDHLHNWYDATDEGALYPTDMNGHGTHTMGTIVGQGGIGVAPGARWMAAKGLNGQGFGFNSWLHDAFQFMLAPGGDPAAAPDIVSNSWSSSDSASDEFSADIAALNAAGLFVVFANGNTGPNPGTVSSPASLPNAIGVGATDPDDDVAYFSSRGPSPFGDMRPQLSAPGVEILSSYPGGRYATASGTSMATPHVAGAAALLLSASPGLNITATLYALTHTAVPLTSTVPNNNSGWGRIDAFAAVLSVISTGVISGSVLDGGLPISGAQVTAFGATGMLSTFTRNDGSYLIVAPPGIYTATASAYGYLSSSSAPRVVIASQAVSLNFNLSYRPSGVVRGTVKDVRNGASLTLTVVSARGTPRSSLAGLGATPPYRYVLDLPGGIYTLEARLLGYGVQTRTVSVADGAVVDADFVLTPTQRIALVDSGGWYYASAASYYQAALDQLSLTYDVYPIKRVPGDTPTITQLLRYDTVIWSAPFDSPALVSADKVISALLDSGHNVLLSGQDIAFYDGGGFFSPRPYFTKLDATFVADDTPSRVVNGAPNSLLAGKVLTITGGDGANNQNLVDVVALRNADYGMLIGRYTDDLNGHDGAGIYTQQCVNYRAAYFPFGLEGINNVADRMDVIQRVLNRFETPRPTAGIELLSRDNYPTGVPIDLPGQTVTHTLRVRHIGDAGSADTLTLNLSGNQWPTQSSTAQVRLAPCASAVVTLSVTLPPTATWNSRDVVTLTATSANSPSLSSAIALTSKTPAPILLVDDDRFFNHERDYLQALAASGNSADRWDNRWQSGLSSSPPITTLRMYPVVVWFNAYDWFDPITLREESRLAQYLDGGGRLFFTSQAALAATLLSSFNHDYLGVADINFEDTLSNVVGAPGTFIGDGFRGGSLLPFPYSWNLSSSMQPTRGTQVILRGDSGQPFGLARECASPCIGHPSWRTVFMPFAFETLPPAVQADLMNRVVGWLTWLGHSSLTSSQPAVLAGDALTYTVELRADDVLTPQLNAPFLAGGLLSSTASLSASLDANLMVISSTLAGATEHNAGTWSGLIHSGELLTWTFVATTPLGLAANTSLTATLHISLDDLGLRFTREQVVYVHTPVLSSSLTMEPTLPKWGQPLTFTLRITNPTGVAATGATMVNALPWGLSLTMPSLVLNGSGVVTSTSNRIQWAGDLAAGAALTVTYQVSLPPFNVGINPAYYNAAQIDNGAGSLSQSALWVAPMNGVYYLPLVMR